MNDPVQEFIETRILQQGALDHFAFEGSKTTLFFGHPRHFEMHFLGVSDHIINMPLIYLQRVKSWTASRDSEFLRAFPKKWLLFGGSPRDFSELCHFEIRFTHGSISLLAENSVFMMVSR